MVRLDRPTTVREPIVRRVAGMPDQPADRPADRPRLERTRAGRSLRNAPTEIVWDALQAVTAGAVLDVVDVGGGTGGFAVPLATLGHRVTVVDPSPDAL